MPRKPNPVKITQLADSTIRRAVTVPAVVMSAATLASSIGVWAPATAAFDLVNGRTSVPRTRMLSLALAWSSLESVGVGISAALWATGRSNDDDSAARGARSARSPASASARVDREHSVASP